MMICDDWERKTSETDLDHAGLVPSQMRDAIVGSITNGASGIRLYAPAGMTETHWNAFAQAMQEARNAISDKPLSRARDEEDLERACRARG